MDLSDDSVFRTASADEHLRKVCTLRSNGKVTDKALSRDGAFLYTASWKGMYRIDLRRPWARPGNHRGTAPTVLTNSRFRLLLLLRFHNRFSEHLAHLKHHGMQSHLPCQKKPILDKSEPGG